MVGAAPTSNRQVKPQYSLKDLVVIVVVLGCMTALALPSVVSALRNASSRTCAANLRALWNAQFDYAQQYASPQGPMRTHSGKEFWLKLQRPSRGKPSVVGRHELFFCPLSGDEIRPNETSYRGPSRNIYKFDEKDPIAGDREGNHGTGEGGNLLTQTGDVSEYPEVDPLWIRARVTTKE
jgi:hypothetical protein